MSETAKPLFRRVVVKLSGEALMGSDTHGLHAPTLQRIAADLKAAADLGVEVAVVVGGGNFFRGLLGADKGADPRERVKARGRIQVNDRGAIEAAVDAVIAANAEKAEQAKTKPGMLGWFVGQVMKQTGGKANPQAVNDVLKRKLGI